DKQDDRDVVVSKHEDPDT
ncbi:hypothetical protein L195_g029753, partial [Trifolium pratense]